MALRLNTGCSSVLLISSSAFWQYFCNDFKLHPALMDSLSKGALKHTESSPPTSVDLWWRIHGELYVTVTSGWELWYRVDYNGTVNFKRSGARQHWNLNYIAVTELKQILQLKPHWLVVCGRMRLTPAVSLMRRWQTKPFTFMERSIGRRLPFGEVKTNQRHKRCRTPTISKVRLCDYH